MSKSIGCTVVCGSSNSRAERRAGGFTLLEILIAFSILAVALVALLQAFSQGLSGLRVAEERATAVMLARSKLAEVGESIPLEELEENGEFVNGFEWRLAITSREDTQSSLDDDTLIRLYDVSVVVERGELALAEVRSMRVGGMP